MRTACLHEFTYCLSSLLTWRRRTCGVRSCLECLTTQKSVRLQFGLPSVNVNNRSEKDDSDMSLTSLMTSLGGAIVYAYIFYDVISIRVVLLNHSHLSA